MAPTFGLFILAILLIALYNRRKENKAWVQEERNEESGDWIDKRAGERGTYGSLDAEREAERHTLTRQGRINDLALDVRNFAFEHLPGFAESSDEQLRVFTALARERVGALFNTMDALKKGQPPVTPESPVAEHPQGPALKKMILDACYKNVPALLELDLDLIRQFDGYVGNLANTMLGNAPV